MLIVSMSTRNDLLTLCNAIFVKFEGVDKLSYIWLKSLVIIFIFHARGGCILVPFLVIDFSICAKNKQIKE